MIKFCKNDPRRPECCVPGCTKGAHNTARSFKRDWRRRPIFNRFFGHSGYVCKDHHDEYIAVVLHGLGMIEELREFRRLEKEAKMATTGNLDNFLVEKEKLIVNTLNEFFED